MSSLFENKLAYGGGIRRLQLKIQIHNARKCPVIIQSVDRALKFRKGCSFPELLDPKIQISALTKRKNDYTGSPPTRNKTFMSGLVWEILGTQLFTIHFVSPSDSTALTTLLIPVC